MSIHHERMKEELRAAAAEFLSRNAGPQSLITVTATDVGEESKHATIYITVMPVEQEGTALAFANRNRSEFSDFLHKRVRGMRVGHIEFVIDKGEKMRQRLDELS